MTSKELEIFNQMPFFFWVKDEEGTYLWVNKALREMSESEIVGKKDSELPWAAASVKLREHDLQVLKTGKPIYLHEYVEAPYNDDLSVCKFVGEFEGKRCAFGISFVIPEQLLKSCYVFTAAL